MGPAMSTPNDHAEHGTDALDRLEQIDSDDLAGVLVSVAYEDEKGVALDSWLNAADADVSPTELSVELLASALASVARTHGTTPKRAAALALKKTRQMDARPPGGD